MTLVITTPCAGVCDAACTTVCPIPDCILGPVSVDEIEAVPKSERAARFAGIQLYIDPDLCIDCGACLPQCPAEAIFYEDDVPEQYSDSIAENAAFFA
jgi:ferredoxin